jgi:hypothetical protein
MRVCLPIALLAALGCDSSSTVNITKPVGNSGGTVSDTSGNGVQIPMGALSSQAMITVSSVSAPAPAGTVAVGAAVDFGPDGTTFAQPVTITLAYNASMIPAGRTASDIVIYTAARGSTQYTPLPTTVQSATLVKTTTTHFTVYVPAVSMATVSGDLSSAPTDMASSTNCVPVCMTTSGGCTCTGTCSGQTVVLGCAQEVTTSPPSCYCEVNNQTMAGPSPAPTSASCSTVQGFFMKCVPTLS